MPSLAPVTNARFMALFIRQMEAHANPNVRAPSGEPGRNATPSSNPARGDGAELRRERHDGGVAGHAFEKCGASLGRANELGLPQKPSLRRRNDLACLGFATYRLEHTRIGR